jgi:hypothetical protein
MKETLAKEFPTPVRPTAAALRRFRDERHGDPRKVTGSSQRSPLHAAGSGRCLHFGKCALMRETEGSNPAPSTSESDANLTDKGSNRRPSRPEPRFRIHLSPPKSQRTFRSLTAKRSRKRCSSRYRADPDLGQAFGARPPLHQFVPWFVVGFLGLAALRSGPGAAVLTPF